MKKTIIIIIGLLICFPLTSISREIYFERGIVPTRPLKNKSTGDMHIVVIVENASFRNSPKRRGKELPNPPNYLETLLAYDQTRNGRYYLVKKSTGEWGWMKDKEILVSETALRSEDRENPAFLKILAKNNWRKSKTQYKVIPIRKGPGAEFSKCGETNIFQIHYAFKMEPAKNGDMYVFIGENSTWDSKQPAKYLTGWIKKDFAIPWDNQIGIYYHKENLKNNKRKPALIFKQQKDLIQNRKDGIIGEEENQYEVLDPDTTRFPVLDHQNDMMRIAWVGDAVDKNSMKIRKKRAIEKDVANINRIISQIEKVDILFLVDATKSMRDYFNPVARGIAEFIDSLSNRERSRYKFAFAVYRDHKDTPRDFELISNFGVPGIVNKIKQTAIKTFSKNKDFPEAIYQAIYKGVSQLFPDYGIKKKKIKGGFTRAVVLVGDHGNHNPPKRNISQKNVTDLLIERNIAFYAINVRVRENVLRYNQLFQEQMKSIVHNIGSNGKTMVIDSIGQDEISKTKDLIIKCLKEHFEFSNNTAIATKEFIYGTKSEDDIRRKYGTRITNNMINILRKNGWTEKEIKLADFRQFCEKGWISKKDKNGVDQFKAFCLIPRVKLVQLYALLNGIKDSTQTITTSIDTLIQNACEKAVGDPMLKNESPADYIQRLIHIPFREISTVLRKTPVEIKEALLKDDDYRKALIKQINKKYWQLDYIIKEKIVDLRWDESKEQWLKYNIREKDWFFTTSNGLRYCWLPFEYLP